MLINWWQQPVLLSCQRLQAAEAQQQSPPVPFALLVIVVDALDECCDADEIQFVLALLSETSGLAVAKMRIFLTSPVELLMREGVGNMEFPVLYAAQNFGR